MYTYTYIPLCIYISYIYPSYNATRTSFLPGECGQRFRSDLVFDLLLLVSFDLGDQGREVGLLELGKGLGTEVCVLRVARVSVKKKNLLAFSLSQALRAFQ